MALDTWLIYLLAAVGLSLSPGPNGLLALTRCSKKVGSRKRARRPPPNFPTSLLHYFGTSRLSYWAFL